MRRVIFLIALILLLLAACAPKIVDQQTHDIAQCLTDNGMVMYGAFWCGHCQEVKQSFGDAFDKINYVECDPKDRDGQPDLCMDIDIKVYPTFIFDDQTRIEGSKTIQELAIQGGCQ